VYKISRNTVSSYHAHILLPIAAVPKVWAEINYVINPSFGGSVFLFVCLFCSFFILMHYSFWGAIKLVYYSLPEHKETAMIVEQINHRF